MEFSEINIPEMEKQRYESIKRTNKYLEMKLIIGVEGTELGNGVISKEPVVMTSMCNCGPQEVGCFYMTLQAIMKSLEKQYPAECYVSKLTMRTKDMGTMHWTDDKED